MCYNQLLHVLWILIATYSYEHKLESANDLPSKRLTKKFTAIGSNMKNVWHKNEFHLLPIHSRGERARQGERRQMMEKGIDWKNTILVCKW